MRVVLWSCTALVLSSFALQLALLTGVVVPASVHIGRLIASILFGFIGALNHRESRQSSGYVRAPFFSLFKSAHRWVAAMFVSCIAAFAVCFVLVLLSDSPSSIEITTENLAHYPAMARALLAAEAVVASWAAAMASSTLLERHGR